jgi:hypothetical protein
LTPDEKRLTALANVQQVGALAVLADIHARIK